LFQTLRRPVFPPLKRRQSSTVFFSPGWELPVPPPPHPPHTPNPGPPPPPCQQWLQEVSLGLPLCTFFLENTRNFLSPFMPARKCSSARITFFPSVLAPAFFSNLGFIQLAFLSGPQKTCFSLFRLFHLFLSRAMISNFVDVFHDLFFIGYRRNNARDCDGI